MSETLILPAERVDRMIVRLAYEIVERNRGSDNLILFGIRERGEIVAGRIARAIAEISDEVPTYPLDVSSYRDDVPRGEQAAPSDLSVDVTEKDVVLVDDVLFTGRTARAALDAIVDLGRPSSIQLVALVDRGHREYPIQPDYVGRVMPTKHRERVEVRLEPDPAVYVVE